MKNMSRIITAIMVLTIIHQTLGQYPQVQWQTNLGGSGDDRGWRVLHTTSGELLVASIVTSNDLDVPSHDYNRAFFLASLTMDGNINWGEVIGYVTSGNRAVDVIEVEGLNSYWTGTSVDSSADLACLATGPSHIWLSRVDETGGALEEKCLGGSQSDFLFRMFKDHDQSFFLIGSTSSSDGDITTNYGGSDLLLVKLSPNGEVIFNKCYGGSGADGGRYIYRTSDNHILISGTTRSDDGLLEGINVFSTSYSTAWLLKLDDDGEVVWQNCYGGEDQDIITAVGEYSNGDIWTVGYSRSNSGLVDCNAYNTDVCWVMRLDPTGNVLHRACFGGSMGSLAEDALLLPNDRLLLIGVTASNDGDVSYNHGATDAWLIQLDTDLSLMWEKTYGGSTYDRANSALLTSDGGLVFVGASSSNDGDLTGNHGMSDVWVVKLAPWDNGVSVQDVESKPGIQLFPNPANDLIYVQLAEPSGTGSLKIFDLLGALVHEQRVPQGQRRSEVPISSLARSAYVLQLQQDDRINSVQFIKY